MLDGYNYVRRYKIIRRIMELQKEREEFAKNSPCPIENGTVLPLNEKKVWSELELLDMIIGELEELIT